MSITAARLAAVAVVVGVVSVSAAAAAAKGLTARQAVRTGTTYISKLYGYEITLNGKYTMTKALFQWDGSFPFGANGMVDITIDPHDRKFIIAAKHVSSKMTLAGWQAFIVAVKKQNCTRLRDFRSTSLGGVPAREFVNSCPEYGVITLAALHNGRGYLFEYLSPTGSSASSARRTYEAGRRSFRYIHP